MPTFDEWQVAPDGTAPPDAAVFEPPGGNRAAQVQFCLLNQRDEILGVRCTAWLKKEGIA